MTQQSNILDLEDYVDLAIQGDWKGIEHLYSIFLNPLYRYCFWYTQNREIAEDLASETMLDVIQYIQTFQGDGSIRNWIYTIAKRKIYSWMREKYQTEPLDHWERYINPSYEFVAEDNNEVKRSYVDYLLSHLTEQQRELLILKYERNYSIKEIAEVMGLSISQVKVYLFRARELVKKRTDSMKGEM